MDPVPPTLRPPATTPAGGQPQPVPALAYPRPGHQAVPSFGLPPVQPAPPSYDPSRLLPPPGSGPTPMSFGSPGGGPRVTVIVLAALLALFVLASGLAGALYVNERQDGAEQSDEIGTLQDENANLQRELNAAERDRADAESDLADLTQEHALLSSCVDAIYAWWLTQENTPEYDATLAELDRRCSAAGRPL